MAKDNKYGLDQDIQDQNPRGQGVGEQFPESPISETDLEVTEEPSLLNADRLIGYITRFSALSVTGEFKGAARKKAEEFIDTLLTRGGKSIDENKTIQKYKPELFRIIKSLLKSYVEANSSYSIKKLADKLEAGDFPEAKKLVKDAVLELISDTLEKILGPFINPVVEKAVEPAKKKLTDQAFVKWIEAKEALKKLQSTLDLPFLDDTFANARDQLDRQMSRFESINKVIGLDGQALAIIAKLSPGQRDHLNKYLKDYYFSEGSTYGVPLLESAWPQIIKEHFFQAFLEVMTAGATMTLVPPKASFPVIKKIFTEFSAGEIIEIMGKSKDITGFDKHNFQFKIHRHNQWEHWYHFLQMTRDNPELLEKWQTLSQEHFMQFAQIRDFYGAEVFKKFQADKDLVSREEPRRSYELLTPALSGMQKKACLDYIHSNLPADQFDALTPEHLERLMKNLGYIAVALDDKILQDRELTGAIFDFVWYHTKPDANPPMQFCDIPEFIKTSTPEFLQENRAHILAMRETAKSSGGRKLWEYMQKKPPEEVEKVSRGCERIGSLKEVCLDPSYQHYGFGEEQKGKWIDLFKEAGGEHIHEGLIDLIKTISGEGKTGCLEYKKKDYSNGKYALSIGHSYEVGALINIIRLNPWLSGYPEQDYELVLKFLGVGDDMARVFAMLKQQDKELSVTEAQIIYAKLDHFHADLQKKLQDDELEERKETLPEFQELSSTQKKLYLLLEKRKKRFTIYGGQDSLEVVQDPERFATLKIWIEEPYTQSWPFDLLEKIRQKPGLKGLLYYIHELTAFDQGSYEKLEELHDQGLPAVYYLTKPYFNTKQAGEEGIYGVMNRLREMDVKTFLDNEKRITGFIDNADFTRLLRNYGSRPVGEHDEAGLFAISEKALKRRVGGTLKKGQELEEAIEKSPANVLIRRVQKMKAILNTEQIDNTSELAEIDDETWEKNVNSPHFGQCFLSHYQFKDLTWLQQVNEELLQHPKFWQYRLPKTTLLQHPDIALEILNTPLLTSALDKEPQAYTAISPLTWNIVDFRINNPRLFQEPYISLARDFADLEEMSHNPEDIDVGIIREGEKEYYIPINSITQFQRTYEAGELIVPPPELNRELREKCLGKFDWHIAHLMYGYQKEGIASDKWRETFWAKFGQEDSGENIYLTNSLGQSIHQQLFTENQSDNQAVVQAIAGAAEYILRHNLSERFSHLLSLADSNGKKSFIEDVLDNATTYDTYHGPGGSTPKADYKPNLAQWDQVELIISHQNFDLALAIAGKHEILSIPVEYLQDYLNSLTPELVEFERNIPSSVKYQAWQVPAMYSNPKLQGLFQVVGKVQSLVPKNWNSSSQIRMSNLWCIDSENVLSQLEEISTVLQMGVEFGELGQICQHMSANGQDIYDLSVILKSTMPDLPIINTGDDILRALKSMPISMVKDLFDHDDIGIMGWKVFNHVAELKELNVNEDDLRKLLHVYWKNNIDPKGYILDRKQTVEIAKTLRCTQDLVRLWRMSDQTEDTFKQIIITAKASGKFPRLFDRADLIIHSDTLYASFTPEAKMDIVKEIVNNHGDSLDYLHNDFFRAEMPAISRYCTDALDLADIDLQKKKNYLRLVLIELKPHDYQTQSISLEKLIDKATAVPRETRYQYLTDFVGLLDLTNQSQSPEVQKIKFELLSSLLDMPGSNIEEQRNLLEQLIAFFEKNNIPLCGKVAEVFRRVYNKDRFTQAYQSHRTSRYTATLQELNPEGGRNNYTKLVVLFRNDLLHSALRSNDANLRAYFEKLIRYTPIIDKFQDILEKDDEQALQEYIDSTPELAVALEIYSVVADTVPGNIPDNAPQTAQEFRREFKRIRWSFNRSSRTGRLSDNFVRAFFGGLGIKSPEEALEYMNEVSEKATDRNREYAANGQITIGPDDYVKGMNISAIDYSFSEGNKGREFLGANSHESDSTPFDVDWTRINGHLPEDADFTTIIRGTSYPEYSGRETGIGLIIKNRGQFYENGSYGLARAAMKDIDGKYETVYSGVVNSEMGRHYGIRTAAPVSEFSAVVVNAEKTKNFEESLRIIKENIARSGIYIPICDITGKVIFAYEEWHKLNSIFRDVEKAMDDEEGDSKFNEPIMEAVPGPRGSTPCQWFQDSMGNKYLYKFYGDLLKSVNEGFYCRLYRHLGFNAPKSNLGRYNGKAAFVSQEIVGAVSANGGNSSAVDREKIKGFVADCLFANWDAPQNDNILYTEGEHGETHIWRVDNGGAGIYRAADLGGASNKKDSAEFGNEIKEFESFFSPTVNSGYLKFKDSITAEMIIEQGEHILSSLTPEAIDELYEKSGMLAAEMGEARKSNEILKQRLESLRQKIEKLKIEQREKAHEIMQGKSFSELLEKYDESADATLGKIIPLWVELNGENGYQHNMDHVGRHTIRVMNALKSSSEYAALNKKEQEIALLAAFFHDFGKPHGQQGEKIARDYGHDEKSARLAHTYLSILGYDTKIINTIKLVVLNDGQVSDWARGKNPDLTVESFRERLQHNQQAIRILRAMNAADVRGLQDGEGKFDIIAKKYNLFFDQVQSS